MRVARHLTPALAGLLIAGAAYAQGTPATQANQATQTATAVANNTNPGTLSASDKSFLTVVSKGANYELALAKLAAQKASHADIKQYAQTVVADHQKLNSDLHELAQKGGVTLPPGTTQDDHDKLTHLQSLSGNQFDKAYVQELKRINKKDSGLLNATDNSSKNTAVQAFVKQMKTADDKHEEMAKKLEGYS